MTSTVEVKVPDIGGYDDVPVIEVLVAVGDTVDERPGPGHAGIGQGDDGSAVERRRRRQGIEGQGRRQGVAKAAVIAVLDAAAPAHRARCAVALSRTAAEGRGCGQALRRAVRNERTQKRSRDPSLSARCRRGRGKARRSRRRASGRKADIECQLVVLGAGPGGYTAAFRAADLGLDTVLVERYAHARRRLPQRRLHSVEGAAACGRGDRRSRARAATTASTSARRRSHSTSCARSRTRSSAS